MTAQGGTGERVILDRVTGRVIGVEANPAQKPPSSAVANAPRNFRATVKSATSEQSY